MCSVVGYIGTSMSKDFVLSGLSRLEYRGYDSAGFACYEDKSKSLQCVKAVGPLSALVEKLGKSVVDGQVSIGHTRWSTHGKPSEINAHPHVDCKNELALVHNGIIENYAELKAKLADHIFVSETDTEVLVHLLESIIDKYSDLHSVLVNFVKCLKGAFAIVFISKKYPDKLMLIRRKSPLCVGIGNNELYVASDTLAFSDKTDKVVYLPEDSFAILEKNKIELFDFAGKSLAINIQKIDSRWKITEKGSFESYMLKEIYEQKGSILASINYYQSMGNKLFNYLQLSIEDIINLKYMNLFACGTSWHAGLIGRFFFENILNIKSEVYLSSEFRYLKFFPQDDSLFIAISQSGETADTLEALRMLNDYDQRTIALTNVASSSMVREATGFLIMQAGPELAVASTKAFSTQIATMYWLANKFALLKGIITEAQFEMSLENLMVAAQALETCIENYKRSIEVNLAPTYSAYKNMIFLGRGLSYPFALEAALKLKEIAYTFVQVYPAGELKHGPIALVEKNLPVFIFSDLNEVTYQKLLGNVQEVKARGARVFSFAFEEQYELIALSDDVIILPRVEPLLGPLVMTGVVQYFVYSIARHLGRSIDKPRNLAKSVTVE